jgi:hypothetical protein
VLEEWRPVKDYEGLYEVSNLGNVKGLDRKIHHWQGGESFITGKILTRHFDGRGYAVVHLSKDNKGKLCKIHLLVWDVFGDKRRDGRKIQVDHIDNNKSNCCIDNLQLLNNKENTSKDRKSKYNNPTGVETLPSGKFRSRININGETKHLGCFRTKEEAINKYQETIRSLNQQGATI